MCATLCSSERSASLGQGGLSALTLRQTALRLASIAIAYFAAHLIAFLFPDAEKVLAAVWPAGGIGLAALLLNPRSLWPAILVALFVAGNTANLLSGRPLFNSVGFMTANILESLTCAWVMVRLCGPCMRFTSVRGVMALIAVATLVNACTAFVGAGVAAFSQISPFWDFYKTWWIVDGLGILLVTPLIVEWSRFKEIVDSARPRLIFEGCIFFILWGVLAQWIFQTHSSSGPLTPFPYMLIALLSWPAFRLGQRGVTLSLLMLTVITVVNVVYGEGPLLLGMYGPEEKLLWVQAFVCFAAATGFLLAANRAETEAAGQMLRKSEERLLLASKVAGFGTYSYDFESGVGDWSPEFKAHLGLGPDDPIVLDSENLSKCLHPDDRAGLLEAMSKANDPSGDGRIEMDYRVFWPDGSLRWLHVCGNTYFSSEGGQRRPWQAAGAVVDITKRRQAEEGLRDSEARLRTLLERVPLPVGHMIKGGYIDFINERFTQLFGYTSEDIPTVTDWFLKAYPDLEYRKEAVAAWNMAVRNVTGERREIEPAEYRVFCKNGEWRDVMIYGITMGEELLVSFVDITAQKQAAEEKAKLENQLMQANKMNAIGRLAGGVAHDFNNMLGVILGHVEMALDLVAQPQPVYGHISEVRKAATRSANLTRQLLAFARRQPAAPKVIDLNQAVEESHRMLLRLIGEDIALDWLPGKESCEVKVDPSQIDQILTNICVNARDAISGMGKIAIETKMVPSSDACAAFDEAYCSNRAEFVSRDYVRLSISDNGCGMDKKTLDNLFEPFFTTKAEGKGTGLGLSTVYGIVKQNNGFVAVCSEPGSGTTFNIYLPRHIGKTVKADVETPSVRAAGEHETILIVEDELMILDVSKAALESFGYRVLAASTPEEAFRLANEHAGELRLLITDVIMPKMNGRDLAERLLALHPGMKRLYMSGYTNDIIAPHGILDEGINFIQKPFLPSALGIKVREILDGK